MERVLSSVEVSPSSPLTIDAPPNNNGSGRSWLLFVVKPDVPGCAVDVEVTLHCAAPDVAEGARRRRRISGPDWMAVPLVDVGLPLRAEICVTDPTLVEAYVLHSDSELVVEIPMDMLGEHFTTYLASANNALREIIGCTLAYELGGDFEAKKKKGGKVYICGLNKKNKGTRCTTVNVLVCGKKKDKKVYDDVPVDEIDSGESSLSPRTQAYIDLVADGGIIATATSSEHVEEFNELGSVFRALGLAQS